MKQLELLIDGRFQIMHRLGSGSFGSVYEAVDRTTRESVAIKLEHESIDPSLLESEIEVYKHLSPGTGIPRVHWHGFECVYNVMVFDLLGPSLEDLFNYCNRQFSLKTVLMLADQLLSRLQYIHSRGVIHRDIKPENFLMGTGRRGNQVYITDLGLAWSDHAAVAKKGPSLLGTELFASINGHRGNEQTELDDLESLGYMLVYFLRGNLPWNSLCSKRNQEGEDIVLKSKDAIRTEKLCENLPEEFFRYFEYLREPPRNQRAQYTKLRIMFGRLFQRERFESDNVFDWTILKYLEALSRQADS